MASNNDKSGGIGFFGLLAIVFITLKLIKIITWPWVWVLAPIWGVLVIMVFLVFVIAVIGLIQEGMK